MKMVGVAGALAGWKTNVIVHDVLRAAKSMDSNVEIDLIDLRDYEVEFARGEPLSYYNEDTWEVVQKILGADMLVFGTPVYQASITGALKNLLDHFAVDAFKRKVTGMVTTGGVDKHFLVSEYHLKPVLAYLKGVIPSNNVFVHDAAFNDINEIIESDISRRFEKLAAEMISLHKWIASEQNS